MFRNYLTIAFRNFIKHKTYSGINLGGLSIAIAVCILIGLFVRHEWTFDQFHSKSDRIYRAWLYEKYAGEEFISVSTPYPLGDMLKSTYPEVEAMAHFRAANASIKKGNDVFSETVFMVEPEFLKIFDFPLVQSNGLAPLRELHSVVLTEEVAKKYFGDDNPIGKTIEIRLDSVIEPFVVTAIAKDWPRNSSFQFGFLLPFENVKKLRSEKTLKSGWHTVEPETFVMLKEGSNAHKLEAKFPTMIKSILGDKYKPGEYVVHLQALKDIHLNRTLPENAGEGVVPVGNANYSYILATIAIFILVIACINFMTLSIGRSASRAREVGVRKVMGALRSQLINQFWSEAVLMTFFALAIGIVGAVTLLPSFNKMIDTQLSFRLEPFMLFFLIGIIAVVGLIAGSYPAVVLSGFHPVEVLKGKLNVKGDTSWFRRSLVIIQFGLSVFLIVGTLVMNQQLHYIRNKSLGYRTSQTVVVSVGQGGPEGWQIVERFKNALDSRKEVESVATSMFPFAEGKWGTAGYTDTKGMYREFRFNGVDENFIPAYGIKLQAGRNFDPKNSTDQYTAFIVNEAFVKAHGWKNPLEERLPGKFHDHRIIGVLSDFHFESLHGKVEPLVLVMRPDSLFDHIENINIESSTRPDISVRLTAGGLPQRIAMLEQVWKSVAPNEPFKYAFLDQNVQNQYQLEERLGKLVTIASGLSIFIACLGLFGLATLAVARRTKEIGIRKVLGASEEQLVALLSRDFIFLVLIAMVIAWPIAYWAMNDWLKDFAYKVNLRVWVFVASGLIALTIAAFTLVFQVLRAAYTNPVKSLRSE